MAAIFLIEFFSSLSSHSMTAPVSPGIARMSHRSPFDWMGCKKATGRQNIMNEPEPGQCTRMFSHFDDTTTRMARVEAHDVDRYNISLRHVDGKSCEIRCAMYEVAASHFNAQYILTCKRLYAIKCVMNFAERRNMIIFFTRSFRTEMI